MKAFKKNILFLTLAISGCSSTPSYETVSLFDYTTEEALLKKGLTPEKISEIDNLSIDKKFGTGYSRYEGYHKYKINNFDILVNPNDLDELYIVKDNNYLLGINEKNNIRLFRANTKFPNPSDTAILWGYNDYPYVYVANDKQVYYDLNLNGIDIVFDKKLWTGDRAFANYVDVLELLPRYTISEARIENKQCKPFINTSACCENADGSYTPYQFDYEKGWKSDTNNIKLTEHCNSGDIEKRRKEILENMYDNW